MMMWDLVFGGQTLVSVHPWFNSLLILQYITRHLKEYHPCCPSVSKFTPVTVFIPPYVEDIEFMDSIWCRRQQHTKE